MRGFLVDVEFMWGFQSRVVGMSKTSPSFLLPPPTTLLGALTEVYARRKGKSEFKSSSTMKELAENVLGFSYRLLNAIPLSYQDISRIISIKKSQGIEYPSPIDPFGSYDAPARGKTILSTIDEKAPMLRIFAVFKDTADVIAEDFWKIKRIGSKESMVSVVNVVEGEPIVIKSGVVETNYLLALTPEIESSLENWYGSLQLEFVPIHYLTLSESVPELYLEGKKLRYSINVPSFDTANTKVRVSLPASYVAYKMEDEVIIGFEG